MAELTPLRSLARVDTVYSADCIEFCPSQPGLFACGTYQIEKEDVQPEASTSGTAVDLCASTASGGDEASDGEDEPVAVSPKVKRYGRCLLYQIDRDGSNL